MKTPLATVAAFLLGSFLVAGGVFLTSCIRLPEIPKIDPPTQPILAPNPSAPTSDPSAGGNSAVPSVPPPRLPTEDEARSAVAWATKVYTDSVAAMGRAKAVLAEKKEAAKEAERQAVSDRIVRDGRWIFAAGIVGAIIGVICVAKNYGMGGWWVLLGGGCVSVLGLAMIWLGPHWLGITRISAGVAGVAMLIGAYWAWRHRKKLKLNLPV